jgi:MoaA/NifB/PqqE/SkfB family radical SAM enzyme
MEGENLLMLLLCNYYLTYRCNAYCSFCHFGKHNEENTFALKEDFEKNVSELASMGVKFIDLTGGEPLMHKDIVHFASYTHSLKMQTSITTNTLLYHKYAEKLASKINLLHFSLDSPYEDEHNSIRGVECYQSVMRGIDIAKSLGEHPDILFTVTNQTYNTLPMMHELADKKGLVLIVNPVFSYFGNEGLTPEALDYIEDYCSGKFNIYLNDAFIKLRRDGGNNPERPVCKAVTRSIVISPCNEIILPCYHFKDTAVRISSSVREIMKSSQYKYYEKMEGRFEFCKGCTLNCYFEPSFAFPVNYYSLISLSSKFKYSFNKLVKQKLNKVMNLHGKNNE